MFEQSLEMFERRVFAFGQRKFVPGFAMRQIMRDIANEPGPPDRGTADHHRIGAGSCQHRRRVGQARAIAIRDHRD